MPLRDVLKKPAPKSHKNWLHTCEAALDKEDYEHLLSVMRNEEEYSAAYIANIMTKEGLPVSSTTVLSMRRKLNG